MSCNWPRVQISEVCELIVDCVNKTAPRVDYETPFKMIRTPNVKGGKISLNDCRFVEEDTYEKWTRRAKVLRDDVLLTREAPMGEVGIVDFDETVFLGQRIMQYRADRSKLDPHFLLYSFLSSDLQHQFNMHEGSGSVVSHIRVPDCSKFELNLPPLDVQKDIAGVLKKLDRKISVNQQTNQTLEQMAQAIFKSWFVDFDPVKAKMNGEQPEGMDAATASLFPEKLVESELGLIPEGWEVGTLDTHTSMIIDHRGKTPKKLGSDWVEEGYPAISAKNIKSKKIVRPDTIRFIDEATYKKWMKEPLIKGDIIMTSEAPMGELYFFDGSQDFCLSQRLYGLRANSDICSPEFLFNWLQTTKAKADMEGRASGTTALGIKQAELRKVKILTPPRELLEQYSVVASNLVDMAAKNNAQNTTLEALRDTLLPKLLSGEIKLEMAKEQ
ncbi:TPA: restriction endonuclease subunit S [Vibrio vulnificus]|nr:restriction endonuclease subunit S [Vibrio vulnificus]HAS6259719.1 restriction endonuclease subunit S [Vibrio vulnificus]HDY7503925.1 restriction endonuclease subunit S [Vibrio vulnificus]HDY7773695.1 restriction endonuclease subunit S [Vibrio vulnificus]